MNPIRPNTLNHSDKVREHRFDDSKLNFVQDINCEHLEDVEAKLSQS
jgi:hypothetical protein